MKCFVMMPYGTTESQQKEYSRIYKLLIKSAAEECGLSCIRSDIEGKGGHIMSNVLEDLANDEIAIADLSGLNWTVAYELGMRHVMRKQGTILICNDSTPLPFDVQSLNIFIYPTNWLDDMETLCDKLRVIIQNRLDGSTSNDSPVHEKFPFLPEEVVKGHAQASDDALIAAKARIATLERELADLHSRVESMGLSISTDQNTEIDYAKKFHEELENSVYSSDSAVAKLRELLDQGDKEAFLTFLSKVLSVGFLDEADSKSVYFLCRKLDVPAVTRLYLESVTKFYPENDELLGFLANEYSKNYHTGDRALQLVNGIMGISKKDGVYQLSKTSRITRERLPALFDVYNHLHKYHDLLEIGELILKRFPDNQKIKGITIRNMANSAIRTDNLPLAKEYIDRLLEVEPNKDLSHWVCYRYAITVEDYPAAISELEKCISLDRSDADYYLAMAGLICDELYARDPLSGSIVKIDEDETNEYAVPFALTALTVSPQSATRVLDFLRRNNFKSYIDPVVSAFRAGSLDFRKLFPDLNFGAVDFCQRKS